MPLALRSVQPCFLGSHPVDSNVTDKNSVHFTVSNNTLVGALLQLANVVRHADDIFCDIAEECQKVFERVDVINKRIIDLEKVIEKTDSKEVKIPLRGPNKGYLCLFLNCNAQKLAVGDLKKFSNIDDHHVTKHGFDCHIFTQETRPQCIRDLYSLSETTPTKIIRSCNVYRKDGLCGSKLFKLWPVVYNDTRIRTPDLNFPRRGSHVKSFQKRYKQLRERPKTIHSADGIFEQNEDGKTEEQSLFRSQPSILVAIDTSGRNFERMNSYRSSLKDGDKGDETKKKKRRRTVSGVPENIVNEIKQFEHKQRSMIGSRQEPRAYSFDDLEVRDIDRDEAITKYLDEIDNKIEERQQEVRAMKEPRIMKFFPCRRTKSLPRCVKLGSYKNSEKRPESVISSNYGNSSLSVSTTMSIGSRLSRSAKRSSIISSKLRLLITAGNKVKDQPRPKSLDLDAIGFSSNEQNLARARAPSMPDGVLNRTRDSLAVGPPMGSSTLPRARGKKYDFPWENLPKDWTTSVKLREISKRRSMEDRQSSSGHWSGTSSNRYSLDFDNIRSDGIQKCSSDFSLGKDSGRDSPTEDRCDDTSTTTKSDIESTNDRKSFTQLDTESWLQNLAVRAASREEVSSSSAETLDSLAKLTKKNIMALDLMSPSFSGHNIFDDEVSSVYSVDQEGFYTSFHNDSGLLRSATNLLDDDQLSPGKDSVSVNSFCSNNTVDSVIFRPEETEIFAGLRRGNSSQNKILSKVSPPTAPVRFSSLSDKRSDGSESTINQSEGSPGINDISFSESDQTDQEIVFARVKSKTQITPTMFPSWCSISASETEDDSRSEASSNMANGRSYSNGLSYQNSKCEVVDMAYHDVKMRDSGDAHEILFENSDSNLSEGSMTVLNKFSEKLDLQSPSVLQINNADKNFPINSWPRSRHTEKYTTVPQGSILKTGEKSTGNAKPPKSLNFAPVIDLFNPATTQVEQRPLPLTPQSASSDGSNFNMADFGSINPTPGTSYKLAVPIPPKGQEKETTNRSNLPMKYQPVITVTPKVKSSSANLDKVGAYVKLSHSLSSSPDGSTVNAYVKLSSSLSSPTDGNTVNTGYETSVMESTTPVPSSQSCSKTSPYAISPIKIAENFEDLKTERRREKTNLDSRSSVTTSESGYHGMQSANVSSNRLGSIYSLGSSEDLDFTTDSNYVPMNGPCDSPNLSNVDFPIALTPTGSVDSLAELRHIPANSITKAGNKMYLKMANATKTDDHCDNTSSKNIRKCADPRYSQYSSSLSSSSSSLLHSNQHRPNSPSPGVVVNGPNSPQNYNTKSLSRGKKSQQTKNTEKQQNKDNTNVSTGTWPRSKMNTSMSLPSDVCTNTNSKNLSRNQNQQKTNTDKNSSKPWKSSESSSDKQCTASIHSNSNHVCKQIVSQGKSYPLSKPSNRSGSYRVAVNDQVQSTNAMDLTVRSDSYRVAVRKTNGIVPDIANRNSSYRVAVNDVDIVPADSKFEALSSRMPIGRDMRRMGITDVDQLKQIPDQQFSKTRSAGLFAQIRSSNKRMSMETEVDPIAAVVSRTDMKKNEISKSNKNANRSSTYICFDPIFEDREDVSIASSVESLRVPSMQTGISSGTLYRDSVIFDKSSVNALSSGTNGDIYNSWKTASPGEKTDSGFQNYKSTSKLFKVKNTSKEEDEWKFTVV